MNKHNFHIILLSVLYLPIAYMLIGVKETHLENTIGSQTCQLRVHKLSPLGQIRPTACLFQ